MSIISGSLANKTIIIRMIGLVGLVVYFITSHFTFDPVWLFMALLVCFGSFLFYILTVVTFSYRNDAETYNEQRQFIRTKHSLDSYLVGMEDGVFLLPLIFIGINPLTVGIAAILFGWFNYPKLSKLYCSVKMVAYFIVGVWVLPYGIWAVVLAHIIVDTLVTYNLSNWLNADDEKFDDKMWAKELKWEKEQSNP